LVREFFKIGQSACEDGGGANSSVGANPETKTSAIRTMLHVVNTLRQTRRDPSVSIGKPQPTASTSALPRRKKGSGAGGAAGESHPNPTHWDSLEWLQLDYLDVAKAAVSHPFDQIRSTLTTA
jgi:hypothetical protein